MTLLGDAAVAMWWNVADNDRTEFHEWHSKEHLPERLSISGFNRGSRWQADEAGAFFVLYELQTYETLTSQGYLTRLNDPTPWSTEMMPLHRGMVRSQCRVLASNGLGVAGVMHTIRMSPEPGRESALKRFLVDLVARVPQVPGFTGAHLLQTETPAAAPTREQQIRGGDAAADWILLVAGHAATAVPQLFDGQPPSSRLVAEGAAETPVVGRFQLVHAVTAGDVATTTEKMEEGRDAHTS
ncbi:hypothetical protein [Devosia ginsengisoli]|uniref:hypothetical protein n=1 Tax=Devosia ginsengisoli TaxID=400770 RepID=UPI0026EEF83B|nr:hypothetical protein [Devosia ginsengisoli]MCR6669777.1 hypothetical protein [Devosia ginsengisoli]